MRQAAIFVTLALLVNASSASVLPKEHDNKELQVKGDEYKFDKFEHAVKSKIVEEKTINEGKYAKDKEIGSRHKVEVKPKSFKMYEEKSLANAYSYKSKDNAEKNKMKKEKEIVMGEEVFDGSKSKVNFEKIKNLPARSKRGIVTSLGCPNGHVIHGNRRICVAAGISQYPHGSS